VTGQRSDQLNYVPTRTLLPRKAFMAAFRKYEEIYHYLTR